MTDDMTEYRAWIVAADQKASEAYDKAVMTLSGGALGLSITFVKDVVKTVPASLWRLETSWGCFTLSLALILISMMSSQWALRKTIRQVDEKLLPVEKAGGWFSYLTIALNLGSGLAFIFGVGLLAWFSIVNF